jgi:hypothetical protein
MERVNWVHHLADLEESPPLPWIRWPGAIIGRRRFQRGPIVEFLASSLRYLVVISAGDGYFVISPRHGDDFIHTYHRLTELGSLTPISEESLQPSLILAEVTGRRPLLALLISGGLLNISLLIWVLLVIPNREVISLGFNPAGIPKEALGSVRLILFPIFSAIAYLANLVMGLILFQNAENRSMAYILWLGSLLIAILFHIALLFILS